MSESGPPDPLARFGERLDRARSGQAREERTPGADSAMGSALGFGLRIGIELVAALVVGVALGWVADHFLGTRPWGLILFFFLGSAAGMMNAYRAMTRLGYGGAPPRPKP